jgi:hypothetical protein
LDETESVQKSGLFIRKFQVPDEDVEVASLAVLIVLSEILKRSRIDKPAGSVSIGEDFQALARHQAVAMTFAHMDAFFGNTMRTICRNKPEVLRIGKQLTWASALSFESIGELAESLAEQFIYEFGWQTLAKRLESLDRSFGLKVPVSSKHSRILNLFEQRRHLIIHNGGVITQKYLNESGDTKGIVGSELSISSEETKSLAAAVTQLGTNLFSAVAQKYLKAKKSDLLLLNRIFKAERSRIVKSRVAHP